MNFWGAGRHRRRELTADNQEADRLSWAWRNACLGAGIGRTVNTVAGATDTAPHVTSVTLGSPTRLTVHLLPGQTVGELRSAAPSMAAHLGARALRVEARGLGDYAVVSLLDSDPLDGVLTLPPGPITGPVLLARDEQGQDVTSDPVDLGHVAVQGATRSGKSAWLYSVLAQLSERKRSGYPLEITGVDPSGLLLRPFPGSLLGLTDPAGVELYLAGLVQDMDARISGIPSDRDVLSVTAEHPLRFVALEELPGLYRWLDATDAKRGKLCRSYVARLMAEGHKAGYRVFLVAQRAEASVIGSTERGQCSLRISFRVDNTDAVKLLHPDAGPDIGAGHASALPGIALLSTPGRPLERVRAPWIGSYAEYVRRASGAAQ